jgi:penicillin-binding protein 1C
MTLLAAFWRRRRPAEPNSGAPPPSVSSHRLRPLLRLRIAAPVTLAVLILAAYGLRMFEPLPLDAASSSSRLVLDRDGHVLRAFTTPEGRWRLPAQPDEVSPNYLALLLAFEDRRFWHHPGVDPLALARAVLQIFGNGRLVSGGSTLTMQTARLLRGSPTHSVLSKFQQIADALRLEAALSKNEILSLYLKLAPYGGNLEGVRAASLAYFGKEPRRLSIAEAALLVAIPQSPEVRRLDRGDQNFVRVIEARNRVIRIAAFRHAIAEADARAALAQSLPRGRRDFPSLAAHLSERLAAERPDLPSLQTFIDGKLQEAAEQIAKRNAQSFGEKISIAALVIHTHSGEVRAHIGSAGYFDDSRLGAIDMTAAVRSPGSALKPIIYGLAFEDGLAHPETLIEDRPVRFDNYTPVNFDNVFHGTVTIRSALQLSLNVPAVKVLNEVSPVKLAARFREAGMPFPVPRNLTVALGGTGLSLENLAMLYAALARGGAVLPIRMLKEGPGPAPAAGDAALLLQPAAVWYVTDILRGAPVPPSATPGAIAFKTGTSYGFRDAWAAGYDGEYTVAVWAGRADASSVPGLVGLRVAAPVLFELFAAIGPRRAPFNTAPPNVIGARKAADLPPPLRAFKEQKRAPAAGTGEDPAPRIAFPPANSELELVAADGEPGGMPVALKAEGGKLPLTWYVDGAPVVSSPHRRDAFLNPAGPGFMQITVVDADGRSDRAQIRLR